MVWDSERPRILTSRREQVERDLTKDSSPGYPWNLIATQNQEVMATNGSMIWGEVERRMEIQLRIYDDIFKMSPSELVKNGICDPVKLFIKNEPHSQKKIQSGMLRLISSVSLADQLLTRVICMRQNKMEIANWETCPSKPGMGLHDEGIRKIEACMQEILDGGDRIMATDVSSWDWTVQYWELRCDALRRIKLAGLDENHPMAKLLLVHAYVVAHSVYVDSDGNMFEQLQEGGQLSGDYNTGSTNSGCRVIASQAARYKAQPEIYKEIVESRKLKTNSQGDDTFEKEVPGVPEVLEEIGHIVKQVDYHDEIDGVEFCSNDFIGGGRAAPSDYSKTLFRFLSHAPDDKEYASYAAQLRFTFRHLDQATLEHIERTALARVERARNYTKA